VEMFNAVPTEPRRGLVESRHTTRALRR
jgi:hypothetical protein